MALQVCLTDLVLQFKALTNYSTHWLNGNGRHCLIPMRCN
jgi:hypothetical protein